MKKFPFYLLITILVSYINLQAQDKKYSEVVKIVADYTPKVEDAVKISIPPKIEDTLVERPELKYSISPVKLNTDYNIEDIKAAKLLGEPLEKLYNSHMRAGFGNYITPYAEFFYNSVRSKDYNAGFHFKHLSSNYDVDKDYKSSIYSNNEADVNAKYFTSNFTLFGNARFSRDVYHFYGRPSEANDDTIIKDKQRFSFFDINAGIKSNFKDSKHVDYTIKLGYYNFKQHVFAENLFDNKENSISLDADLSKQISLIKSAKEQYLLVDAGFNYYNNINPFINTGSSVIRLIPKIFTDFNKLKITAGLNFSVRKDYTSTLRIYPVINLNLNLVNDVLYVYAGMDGGLKKWNMKSLSDINPFIGNNIPFAGINTHTNNKYIFYGGVKGSFSRNISFNASVSHTKSENFAFFVIDESFKDKNRFTILPDTLKTLQFRGEMQYQQSEKLAIMLSGAYYFYEPKNELKAWELPEYEIKLSGKYYITEQIMARLDFISLINIYARNVEINNNIRTTTALKTDDIFDINIGGEYRFSKQFSAFLYLNNLTFQSYNRWHQYPSQKFNFLAGVTYSF